MIDGQQASLVICLTVAVVILLNVAIVSLLRRGPGSSIGQIEMLRRAAHRARHPWEEEDEHLKELSRQVAALKKQPEEENNP
ncbi:MAG: hypothetical protein ACOYYS_11625 [Chloroflexota bacterium]